MRKLLSFLVLLAGGTLFAQVGGSRTYGYLDLPASARITALGGYSIAAWDDDPVMGYTNPAMYNPAMSKRLVFAHAFGPAQTQNGYVGYAHHAKKPDMTFGGGLLYRTYGRFDARDAAGNNLPNFSASEYALQAGTAYRGDRLSYGVNAKLLYSRLESYTSVAAAVDLGAAYIDTAKQFTAALVLRNIGVPIVSYTDGNPEELPFDLQIAVSKRLQYLPLQISITLHDLYRFNTRYDDPNAPQEGDLFSLNEQDDKSFTADKIFRHVAISGEFFFGQNVRVRVGYDHQGRAELAATGRSGLTGFSAGAGIRIRQFRLDYGYAVKHISGSNNHLTISTDLAAFGGNGAR